MKQTRLIILFIIAIAMSSCKTQTVISRGTSFGHCVGYCNKTFTLTPSKMTLVKTKNGTLSTEQLEVMVATTSEKYDKVIRTLDVSAFNALEKTIGCPDCADGGAEWLELKSGRKRMRVTFEFGRVPDVLKETVEQLKTLQATLDK